MAARATNQSDRPDSSTDHQDVVEQEYAKLKALCSIFSDEPTDCEQQIKAALRKGTGMLQMDLGIVSHVQGNTYTVVYFTPDDPGLTEGQTFELGQTYCSLTLQSKEVVAIGNMAQSEYSGHPCYSAFGLESYIGVPLILSSKIYGTLNFSSTLPKENPFSESDRDFVSLLGHLISSLMERDKKDLELNSARLHLEHTVQQRTDELRRTNRELQEKIAAHELSQKEILEQKAFLNTLLETIPNPIFYKDIDGRYIGCNKAFEHFINKSRAEIIGKTVFDMGPKELAVIYYQKDRELFQQPGKQRYEWKIKGRGGDLREVIYEKATFTNDRDEVSGIIGTIADITDRKLMEQRLRQAQKLEAIGTLSGGIAHDFNNILSGMLGHTELARLKLPPGSPVQEDLNKVLQAGKRAVNLVKQILAFSRHGETDLQPVQVVPIIKEALKLLEATLPSTIEIRLSHGDDATVLAEPTQFHQILLNLCTNAAHAMPHRHGVIDVILKKQGPVGNNLVLRTDTVTEEYIELIVRDSGLGMSPEIIERIFDPFFTTKEMEEGTGLGLSVVHGIVENFGGFIEVNSEEGKGSEFHIFLPLAKGKQQVVDATASQLHTGSEHVLFVDDEVLLTEFASNLLEEHLGYRVTTTTSSIEAFTLFKNAPQSYDLVITDKTMPQMTGETLAEKIWQIRPGIPIILCSGAEAEDHQKNNPIISAFIPKPIQVQQFTSTVRQLLDQQS